MWIGVRVLLVLGICLISTLRAEDSLKSALNAVNKRQRDLSDYHQYGDYEDDHYSYSPDDENLGLPSQDYNTDTRLGDQRGEGINYKFGDQDFSVVPTNGRFSSPFRERVENDRDRYRERLTDMLLTYLRNNGKMTDDDNMHPLNDYRENDPSNAIPNKRGYYNNLGWDSVGMKKRGGYYEPDGPEDAAFLQNYAPRDDIFNRVAEEYENPIGPNIRGQHSREAASAYNSMRKRFPIAKRSSNYYPYDKKPIYKRTYKKDIPKTDPKVEKDLKTIFNPKTDEVPPTTPPTITHEKKKTNPKKTTKEEVPKTIQTDKPIEINKKSIDWSDYFGLDRRKKSSSDDVDNEWLLERYHKAISLASKRSSEYPLQNFHDHNNVKKESKLIDEGRIKEMDGKLKNIEESIVDDALKFTGAHQGTSDPKEIQDVKDKIISRLASAYSLEKMRRALSEYKQSLERGHANENINEDKRLSVGRKQAVDEEMHGGTEGDNSIKCAHGEEDCDEQNYKPPTEMLDISHWDKGECPKIERACNEVSSVLGQYGHVFETACYMHQMCLLCGDNSWFSPTRQCNVLFLSKANELCRGNNECQIVARQSVKYLLRVNRALRIDPLPGCDLECPDRR